MSFFMIILIIGYSFAAIFGLLAFIFFMLWRNKSNAKIEQDNKNMITLRINKQKLKQERKKLDEKINNATDFRTAFNILHELQNDKNDNN